MLSRYAARMNSQAGCISNNNSGFAQPASTPLYIFIPMIYHLVKFDNALCNTCNNSGSSHSAQDQVALFEREAAICKAISSTAAKLKMLDSSSKSVDRAV
jgi:hypothetical protein